MPTLSSAQIRSRMEDYNGSKNPDILELLDTCIGSGAPYDPRAQYESNRRKLEQALSVDLPSYENLPVRLYIVSEAYSVVFDKNASLFLVDESVDPWHDFYAGMMRPGYTEEELCQAYLQCLRRQTADTAREHLSALVEEGRYDEEYLEWLDVFLKHTEDAETAFFAGRYALAYGDCALALQYALDAYRSRSINPDIWKLLVDAYEALGRDFDAVVYKGLLHEHTGQIYGKTLDLSEVSWQRAYCLGHINIAWAPFYWELNITDDRMHLDFRPANGEFLLTAHQNEENYNYWCGVYNPDNFFGNYTKRFDIYRSNRIDHPFEYSNFEFDTIRSTLTEEARIVPGEHPCVLSIAATKPRQDIRVKTDTEEIPVVVGKNEFRYVRLEKDATLCSDDAFTISAPIIMQHSPQRRKLVLNILLDGLSWGQMKKEHYRHVPNLIKFFSKGMIFDNNYSVAEYTFPSLATIETGMHMHRSQIFHNKFYMELDPQYKTLSEQMKSLGYYCVNIIGDGNGMYNGATRGFDRLVTAPFLKQMNHEGIYRTIEHLEAFSECDNFLFMHIADPHAYHPNYIPVSPYTQAKIPIEKFNYETSVDVASVRVSGQEFLRVDNLHMIQQMDQNLQTLWEYIENHYAEEDYIVHVYSDHGVSVYSENPYYFSEEQCCAALMLRGGGIPALGHVEELTSCLDLYAIMAHSVGFQAPPGQLDANLPAVLGGKERDYVVSNSIFPGQTYKLCIRTADHEFRLETVAPTRVDGTIDLTHYVWRIFRRGTGEEMFDDKLKDFFMELAYAHVKSFQHRQTYTESITPSIYPENR